MGSTDVPQLLILWAVVVVVVVVVVAWLIVGASNYRDRKYQEMKYGPKADRDRAEAQRREALWLESQRTGFRDNSADTGASHQPFRCDPRSPIQ
jgi:hypothetical protein